MENFLMRTIEANHEFISVDGNKEFISVLRTRTSKGWESISVRFLGQKLEFFDNCEELAHALSNLLKEVASNPCSLPKVP